jgi:crotonobetainyl-CoA:carnitine CoA-transferase CaiB-like acyl-CoA transferase
MNSMTEFLEHPQLSARGRWREVGSPVGPIAALEPPGALDDAPARMDPVPALGEHADAILAELGVDPADVARWRAEGVI